MTDHTTRWPLPQGLEPGCDKPALTGSEAALASIAISLKRIADSLDTSINGAALDNLAWTLGQTLGRGFEIGSRRS